MTDKQKVFVALQRNEAIYNTNFDNTKQLIEAVQDWTNFVLEQTEEVQTQIFKNIQPVGKINFQ